MGWWKTLFAGRHDASEPPAAHGASFDSRWAFWSSLGTLHEELIGYRIAPSRLGAPDWPGARRGFLVLQRGDRVVIATDGLSDPFEREGSAPTVNGHGLELMIEAPASALPAFDNAISELATSWPFIILADLATALPAMPGLIDELQGGLISSSQIPASDRRLRQLPDGFIAEGSLGILIGGSTQGIPTTIPDMPLSPVRVVPIVVLTADEVTAVLNERPQRELAALIGASGRANDPQRDSVLT